MGKIKKALFPLILSLVLVMALAPFALAADPAPIDVTGVFSSVTSAVSGAVTDVLPYAAVILGAMLAISIGLRIYRRVVGR